ncbi:hypothetical protein DFH27DRAFT_549949 [Peziza echinospora]|nr:hypothetical protein DFH27DRAFT_549949 [Peziza echinospora]
MLRLISMHGIQNEFRFQIAIAVFTQNWYTPAAVLHLGMINLYDVEELSLGPLNITLTIYSIYLPVLFSSFIPNFFPLFPCVCYNWRFWRATGYIILNISFYFLFCFILTHL